MSLQLFLIILVGLSLNACGARNKDSLVTVGQVDDFPVGSVTLIELDTSFDDPDPPAIGSEIPGLVTQPASMRISPVPIYLVHDLSEGFLALYNRDPHLGCRINWIEARQRFVNPCHGEEYSQTGEYIRGPSPRGLDRFEVIVTDDGDVMIDVSKYQEGSPPKTPSQFDPEVLSLLSPKAVIVQQDYRPTFAREEEFQESGRVPPFTLFADGTVIYEQGETYADQRIMQGQLSLEERAVIVQKMLDFGFERLESYTDDCQEQGNGTAMCVADSSFTILRVLLPSGELREVEIYHDFANDPEAFDGIVSFLGEYQREGARLYVPERAGLFVRIVDNPTGEAALDWPLAEDLLPEPLSQYPDRIIMIELEGENVAKFLTVVERNIGDFLFKHEGEFYATYVVPWLPGRDYRAGTEGGFPSPTPTPTATPLPSLPGSAQALRSPDYRWLASVAAGGTIRVWPVIPLALITTNPREPFS